jgi:hypothetical protein
MRRPAGAAFGGNFCLAAPLTVFSMTLSPPDSPELHARLDAVCAAGWALWERFDRTVREQEFHPFVAADYDVVRRALLAYRAPGQRFLELGSASGVITVMADVLGFDAFGIELDSSLVRTARALAIQFASRAQFVVGSFLPTGYRWRSSTGDAGSTTTGDGPSGYLQLGRALDDFDVVFAYPWGGETPMMLDLMRRYGNPDALLLLHDTNDGVRAFRGGREIGPAIR